MSKKQDREDRILERLQEENRTLKQINRSLQKKLKTLTKGYYKFLNAEGEEEEQEAVQEAKQTAQKICWTCQEGVLELVNLGIRYYRKCNSCTYRTKGKPISELKK